MTFSRPILDRRSACTVIERVKDPGSPAAVAEGCTCSATDNHGGAGWMGISGVFSKKDDCPLHGRGVGNRRGNFHGVIACESDGPDIRDRDDMSPGFG